MTSKTRKLINGMVFRGQKVLLLLVLLIFVTFSLNSSIVYVIYVTHVNFAGHLLVTKGLPGKTTITFFGMDEYFIDLLALMLFLSGFLVLMVMTIFDLHATYGRYSSESKMPKLNARLAWVLQECPSVFVPFYVLNTHDPKPGTGAVNEIIVGLFILHYILRSFVYAALIRGGKPTPVHTFAMAMAFCTFNGYLQTCSISCHTVYGPRHLTSGTSLIGLLLFIGGMSINHHSDNILRNLRKNGDTGYKIPRGGLFEYVSGANFFAEIVEWIGFALIAQTYASFAFAFFTLANIGPRAWHHHRFYKAKFSNYPKERKALIPFLF